MNDEEIISILSKFKHIHWNKLDKDVVTYLSNRFIDSETLKESFYRIKNKIYEKPKCKECGKPLHFNSKGFPEYCSKWCQNTKIRNLQNKINADKIVYVNKNIDKEILSKYKSTDNLKKLPQEYKKYLLNRFNDSDSLKESLYRLEHNIINRPSCVVCGCHVKFGGLHFFEHCSFNCLHADPKRIEHNKLVEHKHHILDDIIIDDEFIINKYKNKRNIFWRKEPIEICEYLQNRFNDSTCIEESYYRIKHKLFVRPVCEECGSSLLWITKNNIFRRFCSNTCAANNENTKNVRACTNIKLFGYDNAYKSPQIKEKIKITNINKYGAENVFQSPIIKEKIIKTNNIKYGADHYNQTPKGRKEISQRMKSVEMQTKIYNTRKRNHTFGKSAPENEIYKILLDVFPQTKHQYRDNKKYPFNCDFYIPEIDYWIEFQGFWTHGKHPFDKNDINDQKYLQYMIENKDNHPLYNDAIKVWTIGDPLKRITAKNNNLNWIEFWSVNEVKEWIKQYKT